MPEEQRKKKEESGRTRVKIQFTLIWAFMIFSSKLNPANSMQVWFEKKKNWIKIRIYHISQSLFQEVMQAKSAAKWASQKYSATHSIV